MLSAFASAALNAMAGAALANAESMLDLVMSTSL